MDSPAHPDVPTAVVQAARSSCSDVREAERRCCASRDSVSLGGVRDWPLNAGQGGLSIKHTRKTLLWEGSSMSVSSLPTISASDHFSRCAFREQVPDCPVTVSEMCASRCEEGAKVPDRGKPTHVRTRQRLMATRHCIPSTQPSH